MINCFFDVSTLTPFILTFLYVSIIHPSTKNTNPYPLFFLELLYEIISKLKNTHPLGASYILEKYSLSFGEN